MQGLNLDVDKGDFVAFMGPSGSGKTTLLNLLGGLDVPTRGTISVAGDEITHMSRGKLTDWRARHVGFIFQMYNLIPVLTAFQNVELPLLLTKLSKAERRKHVETALSIVGLAERMNHYPRAAFRRTGTACRHCPRHRRRPHVPALRRAYRRPGPQKRRRSDGTIKRLVKEHGKTVLMVTHDPVVARQANTTLHLDKGVLVEAAGGKRLPAELSHEIQQTDSGQSVSQEGPAGSDHRVVRRGAVSVCASWAW